MAAARISAQVPAIVRRGIEDEQDIAVGHIRLNFVEPVQQLHLRGGRAGHLARAKRGAAAGAPAAGRRVTIERLLRRSAGHAVHAQAVRLLEGLDGREGHVAVIARRAALHVAKIDQPLLERFYFGRFHAELEGGIRAGAVVIVVIRTVRGEKLRLRFVAGDAVCLQAVILLESLHGRKGRAAVIARRVRFEVAERNQLFLQRFHSRGGHALFQQRIRRRRRGRRRRRNRAASGRAAVGGNRAGGIQKRLRHAARKAVVFQSVFLLKILDGALGGGAVIAGRAAGEIAQINQPLLQRLHGGGLHALLQQRVIGRRAAHSGSTCRRGRSAGARNRAVGVKFFLRRRSRHAVRLQAVRLLKGLHGRRGRRVKLAGNGARVVIQREQPPLQFDNICVFVALFEGVIPVRGDGHEIAGIDISFIGAVLYARPAAGLAQNGHFRAAHQRRHRGSGRTGGFADDHVAARNHFLGGQRGTRSQQQQHRRDKQRAHALRHTLHPLLWHITVIIWGIVTIVNFKFNIFLILPI